MAKKDIVARLLEAKHINFDEALELMQADKEYVYYPNTSYPLTGISYGTAVNIDTWPTYPMTQTGTYKTT